ncbi:hypothetical protein D3C87_1849690 [compost metagenome]
MQQDTGRALHQILLERGNLLGDVIVGRARENGLAAHGLGRLLEALIDRHPIGMRRHHDIHDVGLARRTFETLLRGCAAAGQSQGH